MSTATEDKTDVTNNVKTYRNRKVVRAERFTKPAKEGDPLPEGVQWNPEARQYFLRDMWLQHGDYIVYDERFSYSVYGPAFEAQYVEVAGE